MGVAIVLGTQPEALEVKSNLLAEASAEKILKGTKQMLKQGNSWKNPFGDGQANKWIIDSIV